LTRALAKVGYRVSPFEDARVALDFLRGNRDVLLVVTDLMMPAMDGFAVLEGARAIDPDVGVLMITGHGSVEAAVDAMKRGADDFLTVDTIIQKKLLTRRVDDLETRLGEKFGQLVGKSKAMEGLFRQLQLVAPTRSSVLIIGESGTGKELVANALHENSPRKDARFLPINCAAIPAEILESELFGHEKGSFTGATGRKLGKFELADKGTLFLDEIGELPLEMQVKLLRVLEQREFMRVGGSESIKVDIRLVAATNQDLEVAVEQGRFRSDLYYRLKVVTLRIPALRERPEDIPLLANHFLQVFARDNGREGMRFSAEAMRVLVNARWEGNVRELRNLVESLVVLTPTQEIEVHDLPEEVRSAPAGWRERVTPAATDAVAAPAAVATGQVATMDEIERQAILTALRKTGGNRTQAAELLGIGLRTLQRKLKEYRDAGQVDEF
jgi:DNA-binding NtrC family response regulator